ncbi:non-ribosomal peptide synthetase [Streptomyces sp. SID8352]|uniref:non-ribosomal peptide synthetase n=1 Tax=Streptomyces sp. SID8352 TaxID=2690338 RepID=UPI00136C7713|nr:non-ribosomal peptide synthetase [Streptomyces sp. SID8352]MYU24821.1 amino acid adenylation domain-containing protein [Streptomyces sp. SID8352]
MPFSPPSADSSPANSAFPAARTVHAMVEAQTRRSPRAIALRSLDGQSVTYSALMHRAHLTAGMLRARGVTPGARVGVMMHRTPDLVPTLLAVLLADAAYVPLEPSWPADRVHTITTYASLSLVVHSDEPPALPAGVATVRVSGNEAEIPTSSSSGTDGDTDGVAYVMHTSGSTGRPKGVVVGHDAVTAFLRALSDALPLDDSDRVLVRTSFAFDVSVMEMFWPLVSGASLVFPHPQGHHDPAHLAEVVAGHGVTAATFVPTQLNAFLATPLAVTCRRLRRLVSIGEVLQPSTVAAVRRTLPQVELFNVYGPTEAAVATLLHHCRPEDATGTRVPIGRPLRHTGAHIVDPDTLRPVPPGTLGELVLSGPQIARGYLGQPDLTARQFIADTYSRNPTEGSAPVAYRTGDTVTELPSGEIDYIGREDRQVKVRGHRVELGDIEHALLALPQISDAHAELCGLSPDGPARLAAWVVPAPGATPSGRKLRRALLRVLPAVMVPDAITVLDTLPTLTSGKLDRRRLPSPFPAADRSACLRLVREVWTDLLGHADFTDETTFFDAGGNSLLLLPMQRRLTRAGHEVRVLDLLDHPTAVLLSAYLSHLSPEREG